MPHEQLVLVDQRAQRSLTQVRIVHDALRQAFRFKQVFKLLDRYAEHDVAIHLQESAVAVEGKTRIAAIPRQSFNRLVVEAEVEDRFHHAGHRDSAARSHRDEQWIVRIAETFP